MSRLVARRAAACARPRPSATASAIVAKSTVAQSQTVTSHANPVGLTIAVTVVTAELTQTTKTMGCLMV